MMKDVPKLEMSVKSKSEKPRSRNFWRVKDSIKN